MWRSGFLLLVSLLWPPFGVTTADAATVRLFQENGAYAPNYANLVASLRPGDTVEFGGGRSFVVDKVLGAGAHSSILSIRNEQGEPSGKALRISRYAGGHPILRVTTYADILAGFADISHVLERNGVQSVKVFHEESVPRQFVVVEHLDIGYTYQDFLNKTGKAKDLSADERQRALRDFVPFAISLWGFRTIGDQLPEQIGYVKGRGWVLFDYNSQGTSVAGSVEGASPFEIDYAMFMAGHGAVMDGQMLGGADERLPLPTEIGDEVRKGMEKKRLEAGLPEGLCRRAFRFVGKALGRLIGRGK